MLWAILMPAGIYLIVCAAMWAFQSSFIYFPSPHMQGDPGLIGLEYTDEHMTTEDGVELHGWFVPSSEKRPVVLFCHGNAGNISGRLEMIRLLHEIDLNVFIFDYRGYGKSAGAPSEEGTYLDADAAWEHLVKKRGFSPDRILVFGRSLGSAVVSHLAARERPGAVVLMSAFTSIPQEGQEVYPWLPVKLLSRFSYPTLDNVKKISSPIMVIHGRNDEIISFAHGEKIFAAANEPRRFLEIGGGHNDALHHSGNDIEKALREFVNEYY